jgi:hypothetical protein
VSLLGCVPVGGEVHMGGGEPRRPPDDYLPTEPEQNGGGEGGETGEETAVPPPPTSGYTGPGITGTRSGTYISDLGAQVVNSDLSATAFDAIYQNGGTAWVGSRGTGTANGTFSVPNVPSGGYYLRWSKYYIWTTHREVDLSFKSEGRLGRSNATSASTQLSFDLTSMNPWKTDDDLHFYSMSTGAAYMYLENDANKLPGADDQDIDNMVVPYLNADEPRLVNAGQGDISYLVQGVATDSSNGNRYRRLDEFCKMTNVNITNGAVNNVSCKMDDISQDETINVDWRRSQFQQHLTSIHPLAIASTQYLTVRHLPVGSQYGYLDFMPILLTFSTTASGTDITTGEMRYGDPFEGPSAIAGRIYHIYKLDYIAPGATPLTINGYIENQTTVAQMDSGGQVPLVSPPRSPTIDGVSAFQDRTGMGLNPTLSWTAPAQGQATSYTIYVYRLYNKNGATAREIAAYLITNGTSLTVPSGILLPGQSYQFTFRARYNPGVDNTKTAFKYVLPAGFADALSGAMTTAP